VSTATFSSTALFVWSRNRTELLFCALGYVPLIVGSAAAGVAQSSVFRSMAFGYVFAAPLIFPLVMFIGSGLSANADLTQPEGLFPRHFFTLPAAAHQLVLPFMLYALLFAAAQWSLAEGIDSGRLLGGLAGRPWLPLLATSFVAWMQAVLWTPVHHRLVRATQLLGLLSSYVAVFVAAMNGTLSSRLIIGLSLVQFPIAWAVAVQGVAKCRRGDPSPWVVGRRDPAHPPHSLPDLTSPLDAQLWMERRLHGWADKSILFVLIPGMLLLLLLLALLVGGHAGSREQLQMLGTAIIVLLSCALLIVGLSTGLNFGSFVDRVRWQQPGGAAYLMPPYFAALPLSNGDFAWAKMRAAVERMLWVSAAVITICCIVAEVCGLFDAWLAHHAVWRAEYGLAATVALGALTPIALVMLTLSATASALWIVLTGRLKSLLPWIFCTLCGLCLLAPVLERDNLLALRATVLPITALVKVCGLIALVAYVGARGLWSWARLFIIAGFWMITAGTLMAWISWYVPQGAMSPSGALFLAIVAAPGLGAVAAPVALGWNRAR
jgi:hypothetical protein